MKKIYIFLFAVLFTYGVNAQTATISVAKGTETSTHVDITFTLNITPTITLYSCNFKVACEDLSEATPVSTTGPANYTTTTTVGAASSNLVGLNSIVDDPVATNAVAVGSQISWTVRFKKGASSSICFSISTTAPIVNEIINTAADEFTASIPSCNITLPVELVNFTAQNQGKTNLLSWQTTSEKDNTGFHPERSSEGKTFRSIGFVKGFGTTLQKQNYTFTDDAPLSTSYYRLRQMDNDDKETLSKVISVSNKGNNKLKVYPNPVSSVLTIENTEEDNFQILNLLGQQVLSGKATSQIDVSTLPQGSYVLKVGTEQVKFIKQ